MRLRYIHAVKGLFLSVPVLVLATLFIQRSDSLGDLSTILTVSTFLFAILAGYFLTRTSSSHDTIRIMVGKEDAYWLSLYRMAGVVGKEFQDEVRSIIDRYYVAVYDHATDDYYRSTGSMLDDFYKLMGQEVRKVPPSPADSFDDMQVTLQSVEEARNTVSIVSREKISVSQWIVLILLAILIIVSVFNSDMAQPYNDAFFILFSLAIIAVLLIIRDLRNLRLGGEMLGSESGQEVLEDMGLLRYYHQTYLAADVTKIPKHVTHYRLGTHKIGDPVNIQIVTVA